MKIDYIANYNGYEENLLRLYNFDMRQAIKFRDLIQDIILEKKQRLDLSKVSFVEKGQYNLVLGLFKTDEGILSKDNKNFICALTSTGFSKMLLLLDPFCLKETKSYQYLYELDNPTGFLFSPVGT